MSSAPHRLRYELLATDGAARRGHGEHALAALGLGLSLVGKGQQSLRHDSGFCSG